MNILDFIDSQDIREFHKNTTFAPEEQAVLVVNSETHTIEEKMAALEYLLEAYPDYDAPLYGDGWGRNFRELTQNTLKKWKALLAARYENDGYVYMAELLEKDTAYCYKGYGNLYTDYDSAYEFLQKEKQEYLDDEDDIVLDELGEIDLWDELENSSFFLELPFKAGDMDICSMLMYYGRKEMNRALEVK